MRFCFFSILLLIRTFFAICAEEKHYTSWTNFHPSPTNILNMNPGSEMVENPDTFIWQVSLFDKKITTGTQVYLYERDHNFLNFNISQKMITEGTTVEIKKIAQGDGALFYQIIFSGSDEKVPLWISGYYLKAVSKK